MALSLAHTLLGAFFAVGSLDEEQPWPALPVNTLALRYDAVAKAYQTVMNSSNDCFPDYCQSHQNALFPA